MEIYNRNAEKPEILSPKPMRLSVGVLTCSISNPFENFNPLQRSLSCDQDNEVHSELSCILNASSTVSLSKSLPSPLFSKFSERPPTRHKVNPIIFDENFLKDNCHHQFLLLYWNNSSWLTNNPNFFLNRNSLEEISLT